MSKKSERRARWESMKASAPALEELLEKIAAGLSLRDICAIDEIPYSTVQQFMTTDEQWAPLYRSARERQAEAVMDEIKEIERRLEGDEDEQGNSLPPIDPKAAAVLIGSKQWRAARLNPRRYGERTFQHIESTDMTKLHLEALKQLGRPQRIEALVSPVPSSQLPAPEPVQDAELVGPLVPIGDIDAP